MRFTGRCADSFTAALWKIDMKTGPAAILLAIGAYFGFVVAVAQFHGVSALALGLPAGAIWFLFANDQADSSAPWQVMAGLGVLCLAFGSYYGLFVAPPEQYMGEVQRIMYVHVPTAWNALLAMTLAFACAVIFLFKPDYKWDSRMEGAIEVGVVLAFLLCCQGAIWAKPTWGV